ncbi:AraC family transcriptional regulator [Pedobacter yulinensis]|uniref:AraC family transcriptional regulator n=1 Tax=Pedobacter yulinensis TaxID=2126353 RepID=A0A2T3HM10_9SPHI|nr:AraC family transcriptional regulator [Pedobacter yulinensis]PST83477.1 AraC family transcriptional regulator [Pedobacter yulinensis]
MKLYIKNMVCDRCKLAVQAVFSELGHPVLHMQLGEAETATDLTATEKEELERRLTALGFELIGDKTSRLIEQVKTLIIDLVQKQHGELQQNLSDYLSSRVGKDYHVLSSLFSTVEGITIEKFYIAHKIEKVKELLVYDELSLSEIAYRLNYSSVAYLSSQFKKVTGLTPSHFKKIKGQKRKSLNDV